MAAPLEKDSATSPVAEATLPVDEPTLLVVDNHVLMAEAIAAAAMRAGYSDVRIAASVAECHRILNTGWRPAAILIDMELARPNGFEALEDLAFRYPSVPLVVMFRETGPEDVDLEVSAFVNGAVGLVSKDRGVESLLRVLDVVRHGGAAIPRSISRAVVEALRLGPALVEKQADLSPRQREVLALIARGLTDREIALYLRISLPTVRSHIEAIFEKTATTNRTAAARWASMHLDEREHDALTRAAD